MHFRSSTGNLAKGLWWSRGLLLVLILPLRAQTLQTIQLVWEANSETNVARYNVYYGTASGAYSSVLHVTNVNTALIPNLVEGTTYYFAVTALNNFGLESDLSTELSYTPSLRPTLDPLANITLSEDAGMHTVPLSGITKGGSGGTQGLSVIATSSNVGLIPHPTVTYTSPSTTGSLHFSSVTNASGMATITVTVNNGQTHASRSFIVTVNPVNDRPTISSISAQMIVTNTATAPLSFIIGDIDAAAANLTLSGASSNPTLVPASNIIFGGTGPNRTVQVIPARNKSGTATITATVSDGLLSAAASFQVTVTNYLFKFGPTTLVSAGGLTLNWHSQSGATYRVLYKRSLNQTNWTVLSGIITASTPITSWTDTTAGRDPSRLYRIQKLPPPSP